MRGIDVRERSIGVCFTGKGEASIRVWSPTARKIEVHVNDKRLALAPEKYGYWQLATHDLKMNDHYKLIIDGKDEFPDPASVSQPDGVHGSSRAINLSAFTWSDKAWTNPALRDYIFYELHTGTFTPEGTFAGIEKKLDHLVALGINAIEIMPVAQFAGERNWGYDGVFPFAVQHNYGGAAGLQQLVNTCHAKGIAVVLDVVYNHLGPEGNYLGSFGPYTTEKYKTPWGGAINFDDAWCDGVRQYFIENALMWFRDFHIDALRLDAVHAIRDFSPRHILKDIREFTNELMKQTGRQHYLIVEQDLNDTRYIDAIEKNGYGMHAQWVDEFHHALRIAAGGDRTGYYEDFHGIDDLAKAFRNAYVYDGQFSVHRKKFFGIPASNPGEQFIVFSQNHDQVGNRMLGERTSTLVSFDMQKLLAATVLVSPFLPMLFMGEEWSSSQPFLYFVSHTDPELAEAVRKGRKAEFAAFHATGEAPDPMEEKIFIDSCLMWEQLNHGKHQVMFRFYQALIRLRKSHPVWMVPERKNLEAKVIHRDGVMWLHRWNNQHHLLSVMNFSKKPQVYELPSADASWEIIMNSADEQWRDPSADHTNVIGNSSTGFVIQPESVVIYSGKNN